MQPGMQTGRLIMNNLEFYDKVKAALSDKELKREVIYMLASEGETTDGSCFIKEYGYYEEILNLLMGSMLNTLSDDNSHYADDYLPLLKTFFYGYFSGQQRMLKSSSEIFKPKLGYMPANTNIRLYGDVSES